MKIIFIPTIQHTGTWFVNKILFGHSEVKRVVELASLFAKIQGLDPFPNAKEGDSSFLPDAVNLVTVHFHMFDDVDDELPPIGDWRQAEYYLSKYHRDMLYLFSSQFPTIIPIRDPIKVLINTAIEKPVGYSNEHIVREFEYLLSIKPRPFFLPVDLKMSKAKRKKLLRDMLAFAGLPYEPYIDELAENWQAVNSKSSSSILRVEYEEQGVTPKIKRISGYKSLMEKEDVLRPFFESLGYKNMKWWSK